MPEKYTGGTAQLDKEFPSVSPKDTSERPGGRTDAFSPEQVKAGIDKFVHDQVEAYKASNPNATGAEIAAVGLGTRSTAEKLMGMPSVEDADAQIAQERADRHGEENSRHHERLDTIDEVGDLATEQEVTIVPEGNKNSLSADDLYDAQLEAYAMKPYMDEIAEDRAANTSPVQYVPGENGKMHKIGGVNLPTELKQKHWELEGKANHASKDVIRMDRVEKDETRDPFERKLAAEYRDIHTGHYDEANDYDAYIRPKEEEVEKEGFDFNKWLKQHENSVDPNQSKALRETVINLQKKFADKWLPGRKGELPKDELDKLQRSGVAAINITKNIIEGYFDSEFTRGLEENEIGSSHRKVISDMFETLAASSKFQEPRIHQATGETVWVTAKIDIFEDPAKAVDCLTHAYHEASKAMRSPGEKPMAIAYGELSMQILRALNDNLSIKVPEEQKSNFEGLINSLQRNEQAVSQFN